MTPADGGTARAVEALGRFAALAARDPGRPTSHFRPPGGWMNDPNGTLWDGEHFHLFYQHNPFGDAWGSIHWGHARSRDLVRWEHLPLALTPDADAGEDHCFSGGAWTDPAGRHWLFYSSVRGTATDFEAAQRLVGCDPSVATLRRMEIGPLIEREAPGQPRFGPHWRDPFVFDLEDRTFLTLAADIPAHGGRSVFPLYEAAGRDPTAWTYRGLLYEPPADEHRYHECPNVVGVGGRHVLIFSPHGPVEYRTGRLDPGVGAFSSAVAGRVDHGTHYYATNVYPTGWSDGPVLVGWVRGWTAGRGWNGILGLPRALDLDDTGHLVQRPVAALASLRRAPGVRAPAGEFEGVLRLEGLRAPAVEVEVRLQQPQTGAWGVSLRSASDGTTLLEVSLGRRNRWVEFGGMAFEHRPAAESERKLHLFWDRTVAELFLDDGRDVCTRVVERAAGEPVTIELFTAGGTARVEHAAAWALEAIWSEETIDE